MGRNEPRPPVTASAVISRRPDASREFAADGLGPAAAATGDQVHGVGADGQAHSAVVGRRQIRCAKGRHAKRVTSRRRWRAAAHRARP
jgi:hypothetical protein